MYDVVIIGGSNAGLSAALVLGRARRRVLVVDGGAPRNAPARSMHGFLSRDGLDPAELRRISREQLRPYPSVELRAGEALDAARAEDGFALALDDGAAVRSRKVLLASGVRDDLPPIEGLAALWGRGAFHCPYCHGWEVRDQPLAILADGQDAMHLARLLRGWSSDLALCTNGPADLSADERAQLAKREIILREEPITRLVGDDQGLRRIEFAGAEPLSRRALFVRAGQRQRSELPRRLGCELTALGAQGEIIKVDLLGKTSVPGVYAAGDAATPLQQAIAAAAMGAAAAAGINHELALEDWG